VNYLSKDSLEHDGGSLVVARIEYNGDLTEDWCWSSDSSDDGADVTSIAWLQLVPEAQALTNRIHDTALQQRAAVAGEYTITSRALADRKMPLRRSRRTLDDNLQGYVSCGRYTWSSLRNMHAYEGQLDMGFETQTAVISDVAVQKPNVHLRHEYVPIIPKCGIMLLQADAPWQRLPHAGTPTPSDPEPYKPEETEFMTKHLAHRARSKRPSVTNCLCGGVGVHLYRISILDVRRVSPS
jgi:hypothetical protein